jgi:hypothetical protein
MNPDIIIALILFGLMTAPFAYHLCSYYSNKRRWNRGVCTECPVPLTFVENIVGGLCEGNIGTIWKCNFCETHVNIDYTYPEMKNLLEDTSVKWR